MNHKLSSVLLVVLFMVALVTAAPTSDELMMGSRYTFDNWLSEFMPHKFLQLDTSNYVERRTIFEANMKTIQEHNIMAYKGISSFKMGVNQWTAFTGKEVTSMSGYDRSDLRRNSKLTAFTGTSTANDAKIGDLPDTVDWTTKLEPLILNQGSCGSCYAHNLAAALRYYQLINYGVAYNISRQQIVDCLVDDNHCGGTGGCKGSTAVIAANWVSKQGGIANEDDYPYVSGDTKEPGTCRAGLKPVVTLDGAALLKRNDKTAILNALVNVGPLISSIDASALHLYSSGILDTCSAKDGTVTLNHAVLLVGYGTDKALGKKYLKLQNSWGNKYGEEGFFRILLEEEEYPSCHFDVNPHSGYACDGEDDPIMVCGCLGIYNNVAYPVNVRHLK